MVKVMSTAARAFLSSQRTWPKTWLRENFSIFLYLLVGTRSGLYMVTSNPPALAHSPQQQASDADMVSLICSSDSSRSACRAPRAPLPARRQMRAAAAHLERAD